MKRAMFSIFVAIAVDLFGLGAATREHQSSPPLGNVPTIPIRGATEKFVYLPMVGLGTWLYNNSRTENAVAKALELGYVHIDTALIYGNQRGVGAALKASGRDRKSYFITTKIPGGLNESATKAAMEQDLEELGVSYIDLLLVHYPCTMDAKQAGGKASRQVMWRAMEDFALNGKARAIGVSHYCKRHLQDILSIARVPVAVNQVQFHVGMGMAGPNATDDRTFCKENQVVYESFSPLCGPCGTDELINGPLVTSIGKKYNKTGAQVSLRWQVQQGIPVIPKTDNVVHLRENMDLFSWTLSPMDMDALTASKSPPVAGGQPGPPATSGDCSIL